MSEFSVEVDWQYGPRPSHPDDYSRNHECRLSGGEVLKVSALPEYAGDPDCTNPEEELVAAVSSCHMLTFLAVATKRGFAVRSYRDCASGTLGRNAEGRTAVTEIVLRPTIEFADRVPSDEDIAKLHESAHRNCFIGNSISAVVRVEQAG